MRLESNAISKIVDGLVEKLRRPLETQPMRNQSSFLLPFAIASVMLLLPTSASGQSLEDRRASSDRSALRELPLQTLVDKLDAAPRHPKGGEIHYEALLSELIRRGTMEARQLLSEKLNKNAKQLVRAKERLDELGVRDPERSNQERIVERLGDNLEILTAIYRIDQLRDPLAIEVSIPEGGFKAGTRDLLVFDVTLKNVALHDEAIWLRRSGFRWRIHIWDSDGKLLWKPPYRVVAWSEVVSKTFLEPGKTWERQLDLRNFVDIRKPGKYKVQMFYHDTVRISVLDDPAELDGLIVFQSKPFELLVEDGPPLRILLELGATREAKKHIESLYGELDSRDEQFDLRIVRGEYGPDFHNFVSPTSPQGRLLSMGDQAVPALLEELENKTLTFRKRAWVLSLLYSITGERDLDPMHLPDDYEWEVLPYYEWQSDEGGGSSGSYKSDRRKVAAQLKFAQRWLKFRDEYIEISQRKAR